MCLYDENRPLFWWRVPRVAPFGLVHHGIIESWHHGIIAAFLLMRNWASEWVSEWVIHYSEQLKRIQWCLMQLVVVRCMSLCLWFLSSSRWVLLYHYLSLTHLLAHSLCISVLQDSGMKSFHGATDPVGYDIQGDSMQVRTHALTHSLTQITHFTHAYAVRSTWNILVQIITIPLAPGQSIQAEPGVMVLAVSISAALQASFTTLTGISSFNLCQNSHVHAEWQNEAKD
jgi:hypothetical protein